MSSLISCFDILFSIATHFNLAKSMPMTHLFSITITAVQNRSKHLIYVSRYIMCNSIDELRKISIWEGKGLTSRMKLMEKLQSMPE